MKDGIIGVQVSIREPEPPVQPKEERKGVEKMSAGLSWSFTIPKTHYKRYTYAIRQEQVKNVNEVFKRIEGILDELFVSSTRNNDSDEPPAE